MIEEVQDKYAAVFKIGVSGLRPHSPNSISSIRLLNYAGSLILPVALSAAS